MLSFAGEEDKLVSVEECRQLSDRLKERCLDATAKQIPGVHRFHVVHSGAHGMPPNRDVAVLRTFLHEVLEMQR